jgi:hypothetical protein
MTILVLPFSPHIPNEIYDFIGNDVRFDINCAKDLISVKFPSNIPTIYYPCWILCFWKGDPGNIFVILRIHVLIWTYLAWNPNLPSIISI